MNKVKKFIFPGVVLLLILFVFSEWFGVLPLSTGDWTYRFPQMISEFRYYPFAWNTSLGNSLGANGIFLMPLNTYYSGSIAVLHNFLGLPWVFIEKILWYWPFIGVSAVSSYFLFKKIFKGGNIFASLSSLIFTTNTYALMITGGGQMGVAMGYAMIPLVFLAFISILEKRDSLRSQMILSVLAGLTFSVQLVLDLRIAYVTMILVGIYYFLHLLLDASLKFKKTIIPYVLIPSIITLLLHFFWIVPFVILGQNPLEKLGTQFTDTGIVEFLSFAKFENSLGLLHPNWPENLFGKAYFMRPEFIILPTLAFSALLFDKVKKQRNKVLTLSLIALIGAFLAKGSNEPFGQSYIWMFEHIPGFQMFRDSTKWYGAIALSYSLLIPYVLFKLSKLKLRKVGINKYVVVLAFIIFWLFSIHKVIIGEVGGTFAPKKEPQGYVELTDFLSSEDSFFRTLWVPGLHQYSYRTDKNPAITAREYFSTYNPEAIGEKIENNLNALKDLGVRYIIIPEDTEGKIFIDDRKYSKEIYKETIKSIQGIEGIRKDRVFGKVVVFEILEAKKRFWSKKPGLVKDYRYINPTRYEVEVSGARSGDVIVFAENYDSDWIATKKGEPSSGLTISSSLHMSRLNSFILNEGGDYVLEIYYSPQKLVNVGLIVSGISLFGIIILLILLRRKKP